jgi:prepilin-type N-terminal cleavage/methylation domain-containing protein
MNAPLFRRRRSAPRGFTLMEMMITLAVFIILVAAVFELLSGVLQSSAVLQDNVNRTDQLAALEAYIGNKVTTLPAGYTLVTYLRGNGDGLNATGILFGNTSTATAIDALTQPNGLYTLRVTTYNVDTTSSTPQDARQNLDQLVTTDDPSLSWRVLITDVKTLDWKFQDFDLQQWMETWTTTPNPNMVELTLQGGGDLQPSVYDYWLPKIAAMNLRLAANPAASTGGGSTTGGNGGNRGNGGGNRGGNNPPR